jgi:hypothetical protein
MMSNRDEQDGILPANAWLDKEQLKLRIMEEEIVEIDDFFTNLAAKEMMKQTEDSRRGEEISVQGEGMEPPSVLSFGVEKKKDDYIELLDADEETPHYNGTKRKKLEDMTKDELVRYLAQIPSLMPRPICDFFIDGKKLRGTVEKVKGEYVYIKAAFGKKWIRHQIRQIKGIKIIRF